ncbi:hypothetical protein U875_14165 [Pandoraea pnomenusa 3kgm]|nr:hypothetical protein U875_14165 [Pandoraea pnomenusa 3kgm]
MTQKKVAELIGVEPTNFSRFLNNNGHSLPFAKFCELFDVLGIEAVAADDSSTVTISREEYESLRFFARKGIGG